MSSNKSLAIKERKMKFNKLSNNLIRYTVSKKK